MLILSTVSAASWSFFGLH